MGLNLLSARKLRAIGRAVGHEVIHGCVNSAHESGRVAIFTTAQHRHGWIDRRTGEWGWHDGPCNQSSCRVLFPSP